jgi:hypothetical protein
MMKYKSAFPTVRSWKGDFKGDAGIVEQSLKARTKKKKKMQ